ncbi:hypothetical protein OP10G_0860 [Fimbriimonas ginsengisoli Gsoil 348]|uniref:EcxA zinc-binding domain-containing protein n=1 Tax=Fimbriimonas ginsengisoli Gsoil 348 TaxID=661478 RepID=A0A068NKV6_FIMGI|nr:hypothetical protein OP10G_0860 [Fimbriimonas ginsengisoli Gsoil 348]
MLWNVQLEGPETSNQYTIRLAQSLQVRWVRKEGSIDLVGLTKDRASGRFQEHLVHSFDVRPGESIDVGPILRGDVPELSPGWALHANGVDSQRTRVERFDGDSEGFQARVHAVFPLKEARPVVATVYHSLVWLPKDQMPGLAPDPRIGYLDLDGPNGKHIRKFRLEGQPRADGRFIPAHPIVFEIAPEVPKIWRPYLRGAVEEWNQAYRALGWENVLGCRDATADDTWNPADIRRSVIRWSDGSGENATGYAVSDPRTGETLSGKVVIGSRVIGLLARTYVVQAAPGDPAARRWPLPVDLQGRLLQYTVAHEIGHVLGLDHNSLASSVYTVAQLRNRAFVHEHGAVASIMSYGRFNYVGQPQDRAVRIPEVGDYDRFALRFAYSPTPIDRDALLAEQKTHRDFRFAECGGGPSRDPDVQWEKQGCETMLATELGLRNLRFVSRMLRGWPSPVPINLRNAVCNQWSLEVGHVIAYVGGRRGSQAVSGPPGDVSRAEQIQALRLVLRSLMGDAAMLNHLSEAGFAKTVDETFALLLDPGRLSRLTELGLAEIFGSIESALWTGPPRSPEIRTLRVRYLRTLVRTGTDESVPVPLRKLAAQEAVKLGG